MDWEVRLGFGLILAGGLAYLALMLSELKAILGTLREIVWLLKNPPPPPPSF